MSPSQQILFDAVPASGEITYRELHAQLTGQGQSAALREFHGMRRSGALSVRQELDEPTELYVSRGGADA